MPRGLYILFSLRGLHHGGVDRNQSEGLYPTISERLSALRRMIKVFDAIRGAFDCVEYL